VWLPNVQYTYNTSSIAEIICNRSSNELKRPRRQANPATSYGRRVLGCCHVVRLQRHTAATLFIVLLSGLLSLIAIAVLEAANCLPASVVPFPALLRCLFG
jgi:hypothetical protein